MLDQIDEAVQNPRAAIGTPMRSASLCRDHLERSRDIVQSSKIVAPHDDALGPLHNCL